MLAFLAVVQRLLDWTKERSLPNYIVWGRYGDYQFNWKTGHFYRIPKLREDPREAEPEEETEPPTGPHAAQPARRVALHYRTSPSGVFSVSPMTTPRPHDLAIQLVKDAITVKGKNGHTIPRWEKLDGWTSDRWQKAVDYLEQMEAAKAVDRVGTYVNGFEDLDDLLYELESHSPAPQADRAN
jgi:hypothetical protein